MSYDIIIKNGAIIDGTQNPRYFADVAIKDGKIAKIKYTLAADANKEIDAARNIVCPGFIDIHSHTDYILPLSGKVESSIQQGITTQVVGMCGDAMAPIHPEKVDGVRQFLTSVSPLYETFEFSWNSFSEYLDEMEKVRSAANSVFFVGYNNIRIAGGQGYENRPPTGEEMILMKAYLKEALEAGAFGMSTGLIYSPQVYATTEELIELCKTLAEYGGLYFSHIRGADKNIFNAINEFIEIVEKSGVHSGQIAHFKVAGKEVWGMSKKTLEMINKANERGLNITFDQYPYTRGMSNLATSLPSWALEGGREKTLERIRDKDIRAKIKKDIIEGIEGWENWIKNVGFDGIYISMVHTDKWRDIRGNSIAEITELKGFHDDWETYFQLLRDENLDISITIGSMSEEDVRKIMKSRYQMVGTDGAGIPAVKGLGAVHPRMFGTYPRFISKYVRQEKILSLEEMIRKMTSFPAQKLELRDRGILREDNWADIVIFNKDKIKDNATYDNPHQFPSGIHYVIVNGEIVVDHGKQRRKYPGKVLRRVI
ncbi:MAG: amidohydrolase family protein [Candidatus Lokiarchaeota archaeon]|nr:amidohydrolase family protein [Candidatus Lokiarchaeota archaeon]